MARTISVPQRSGMLNDPNLYEALARITQGVNLALTLPMRSGTPIGPSGTILPTDPITRLVSPGTVRTIGVVDFSVPLFLVATNGVVQLETGGNIGGAATIADKSAACLVYEASTQLWWPMTGGGALPAASPFLVAAPDPATYNISSTGETVAMGDYSQLRVTPTALSTTLQSVTRVSGNYVEGELLLVANLSGYHFDVINAYGGPAANEFAGPGTSDFTVSIRGTRLFHRRGGVWRLVG